MLVISIFLFFSVRSAEYTTLLAPPLVPTIDYRCADKKNSWGVERRHWRHSIGLDTLFQKTPMFAPQKTNR